MPGSRTKSASGATNGRTLPFFLLALGITWGLQLPAFLAQRGLIPGTVENYMLPAALGGFGPLLAALIVARAERHPEGLRGAFQPLVPAGVGVGWYVLALALFPAIYVAGTAVHALFGTRAGPWLYPPENPQQIVAMFLMPIVEEPAWRGLALPRLQQRYSPLTASLVLGVIWAAWHSLMFLLAGSTPSAPLFALAIANIVVGSVLFSWLYNRTRGSLLVALIAHAGVHLNNPVHALPANVTPFVVYTVAIAATGIILLIVDREAWRARSRG